MLSYKICRGQVDCLSHLRLSVARPPILYLFVQHVGLCCWASVGESDLGEDVGTNTINSVSYSTVYPPKVVAFGIAPQTTLDTSNQPFNTT